jgi:hypothetical protein
MARSPPTKSNLARRGKLVKMLKIHSDLTELCSEGSLDNSTGCFERSAHGLELLGSENSVNCIFEPLKSGLNELFFDAKSLSALCIYVGESNFLSGFWCNYALSCLNFSQ